MRPWSRGTKRWKRRSPSKPDGSKRREGTKVVFTEEDQALLDILRRKQNAVDDTSSMSKGNTATFAYLATSISNTNTLASTRMNN